MHPITRNENVRANSVAKFFRYAVEYHKDGDVTLTLFEDGNSASVELSPDEAKELSDRLLVKPDDSLDGDDFALL